MDVYALRTRTGRSGTGAFVSCELRPLPDTATIGNQLWSLIVDLMQRGQRHGGHTLDMSGALDGCTSRARRTTVRAPVELTRYTPRVIATCAPAAPPNVPGATHRA